MCEDLSPASRKVLTQKGPTQPIAGHTAPRSMTRAPSCGGGQELPESPVQGPATCRYCGQHEGQIPCLYQPQGVADVRVGERAASAQVLAGRSAFGHESVMCSRLISSSIWARAAMTVKSIEPIECGCPRLPNQVHHPQPGAPALQRFGEGQHVLHRTDHPVQDSDHLSVARLNGDQLSTASVNWGSLTGHM